MSRINPWIVALLVSVLLNGVLIGAGARHWLAPSAPTSLQTGGPGGGFNLRAFVAALPEDHRAEARRLVLDQRQALRADVRAAGQARRQAYQAVTAEPFDPEAAAAALERARQARAVVEARAEAIILEVADELTAEERTDALRAALGPRRRPERPARSGAEP